MVQAGVDRPAGSKSPGSRWRQEKGCHDAIGRELGTAPLLRNCCLQFVTAFWDFEVGGTGWPLLLLLFFGGGGGRGDGWEDVR